MQMSFNQMVLAVQTEDVPTKNHVMDCLDEAKEHYAARRLNLAYSRLETAARMVWGATRPDGWDMRRPASNETLTAALINHCWRDRMTGTIYTNTCPSCGTQIFTWRTPSHQHDDGQRFDRNEAVIIDQLIQHHACRCTHWREDNKN